MLSEMVGLVFRDEFRGTEKSIIPASTDMREKLRPESGLCSTQKTILPCGVVIPKNPTTPVNPNWHVRGNKMGPMSMEVLSIPMIGRGWLF